MTKQKLILISGANRGIGKTFLDQYKQQSNVIPIGISRTNKTEQQLDLMNIIKTNQFVDDLNLNNISRIVYMHAIGIDKFEPNGKPHIDFDGDGIDDEVYASNYLTFTHLAEPLIEKTTRHKVPMTICNIGSISDIFEVPYWQSFSNSKNKVRQFCKSILEQDISSIMLNVSSTLDENKRTYSRKNIDTTYWQTSHELVEKSFNIVDRFHEKNIQYAELDFYKHNPHIRSDYFTNLQNLFSIWQKELGYEGKEIPHGLSI